MNNELIFLPVIVQIFLTIFLYIKLSVAKSHAIKHGLVDEKRRGLYDDAWPSQVTQINNAITNQFQLPILFQLMIIMLWVTQNVTVWVHLFAWLYVASRLVHAFIHTGSNNTPLRRNSFMVSCVFLLGITLILFVSIASTLFVS